MKKFTNAALFVCAVLMLSGCSKDKGSAGTVIKPFYGSIKKMVSTTGTVKPHNRLEIRPPVGGRVEKIHVREGDEVKSGQILALLSSTERASLLDAAKLQDEKTLQYWEEVYKPAPLVSPINGIIIVRAVEPGQSVSSNDTVLVISDRLVVIAQVDETDVGFIKNNQRASITLDAYPDIKVKGTVVHISFESNLVNNVNIYEVYVSPDKVPDVFRSGMSANVEIIRDIRENVMLLPVEAVNQRADGSYVEVLENAGSGRSKTVKVKTGLMDDDNVEIISGLNDDAEILVKNMSFISSSSTGKNPFMPQRRQTGARGRN